MLEAVLGRSTHTEPRWKLTVHSLFHPSVPAKMNLEAFSPQGFNRELDHNTWENEPAMLADVGPDPRFAIWQSLTLGHRLAWSLLCSLNKHLNSQSSCLQQPKYWAYMRAPPCHTWIICYTEHCYLGKSFDSNLKLLRLKLQNVLKSTPFKCMGKGIELRVYRPGILE